MTMENFLNNVWYYIHTYPLLQCRVLVCPLCSKNYKLVFSISVTTKGFSALGTNQTKEQTLLFLYIQLD